MNRMEELPRLWPAFEAWLLILLIRFAIYSSLLLVARVIRLYKRSRLRVRFGNRKSEGESKCQKR